MKKIMFVKRLISTLLAMLLVLSCTVISLAAIEVPTGITPQSITSDGGRVNAISDSCKFSYTLSNSHFTTVDNETGDRLAAAGKAGQAAFYINSAKPYSFKLIVRGAQANGNKFDCSVNGELMGDDILFTGSKVSSARDDGNSVFVDAEIGLITLDAGDNVITIDSVDPVENGVIKYKGYHVVISCIELIPIPTIGNEDSNGKQKIIFEAETADSGVDYIEVTTATTRTFDFNCEAAGTYDFLIYVQDKKNAGTTKVEITPNGDTEKTVTLDTNTPEYQWFGTNGNIPWSFSAIWVQVELPAGLNKISVNMPANTAFDKFELCNYHRTVIKDGSTVINDARAYGLDNRVFNLTVDVLDKVYVTSPKVYSTKVYTTIPTDAAKADVSCWWVDVGEKNDSGKYITERTFILAAYDENKNMINAKEYIRKTGVYSLGGINLEDFEIMEGTNEIIMYVWDDFTNLTPILKDPSVTTK